MSRFTAEEIERRLTDAYGVVRYRFAQRTDFTPTPAQVERGLIDKDEGVRWAFANRPDFRPTEEQMERGLRDSDSRVRSLFEEVRARLEALELKKRHVSAIELVSPTPKAL